MFQIQFANIFPITREGGMVLRPLEFSYLDGVGLCEMISEGGSLATQYCFEKKKVQAEQPPSGRACFLQRFPSLCLFRFHCDAGQVSRLLFNESAKLSLSQGHALVLCCTGLCVVQFDGFLWHSMCHYPRLFGAGVRAGRFVHFFAVLTIPIDVASRPCVQRFVFGWQSQQHDRIIAISLEKQRS